MKIIINEAQLTRLKGDIIKGGLSDNMTLADVAKKHSVSLEELTKEHEKGIKVELEHTNSKKIASEIAKNHLTENPKYYTKLAKVELEEVSGKDIFVPRNSDRYDDLKKPYIDKGYKSEQILVGDVVEPKQLIGIKVVIGDVDVATTNIEEISINLDEVTGYFLTYGNDLKTLKGSPKKVGGDFNCASNSLTSLEGGPEWVGKDFECPDNFLTTLKGAPKYVGGDFDCIYNPKLKSLDYIGEVGGRVKSNLKNKKRSALKDPIIEVSAIDQLKQIANDAQKQGVEQRKAPDKNKLFSEMFSYLKFAISRFIEDNFSSTDEQKEYNYKHKFIWTYLSPELEGTYNKFKNSDILKGLSFDLFMDEIAGELNKYTFEDISKDYKKRQEALMNILNDFEKRNLTEAVTGKDIFVPRNADRYEDLKKEFIAKGYKSEEIYYGDVGKISEEGAIGFVKKLTGIKVVIGGVYITFRGLHKLPIDLDEVTGDFDCSYNVLTSLKGSPKKVGGDYYCQYNELTSLEGFPKFVGGNVRCVNEYADFTEEDFRKISKIKGWVSVDDFDELDENKSIVDESLKLSNFDEYAKLVAKAYQEAPDFDQSMVHSYKVLIDSVKKMFKQLQSKVKVEFVDYDPYKTRNEMADDVKNNGVLKISKLFNKHPIFTEEENLQLRAVHDYYTHIIANQDFGLRGELRAYNTHARLAPKDALPALFTEIVAQVCYAIVHGDFGTQKVCRINGFDYKEVGKVDDMNIVNKKLVSKQEPELVSENKIKK